MIRERLRVDQDEGDAADLGAPIRPRVVRPALNRHVTPSHEGLSLVQDGPDLALEADGVVDGVGRVSWNRGARQSWQRVFSPDARRAVTAQAPDVKAPRAGWPVELRHEGQFAPLPGFELVDRFRYPVMDAKPIEPPRDVALAGSSSHFIRPVRGNVLVPIGKRHAGLYLVEALLGSYRAATLVFVSDTVGLTKISSGELMVWTVSRQSGRAVPGVEIAWTDGVGTLVSGRTGADGTLALRHASPERTYAIGRDAAGGVFVSENFYYDSEIYNAKIYGFTDRPLYRPGDTVRVKLMGREFKDGRRSVPLAPDSLALTVLDPTGDQWRRVWRLSAKYFATGQRWYEGVRASQTLGPRQAAGF